MQEKPNDSYVQRIDRIVGYLNQQVGSTHTLEELANIAGISMYHFHRVYRAITGETPMGTLRRLRIARAAVMLRDSDKRVTEIAFDVGYESSQAFSKAFRHVAGCSASEIRPNKEKLGALIDELSSPRSHGGESELEVRLISVDPFKVIAARHSGSPDGLFKAFGELFSWAEATGRLDDYRGIYGVPIDDPRDSSDGPPRFDCCFDLGPAAEPDKDYFELNLGGGLYAVTRHLGPYDGIDDKYDFLYGSWLSSSGYVLKDSPNYNHYLADPDTVPPEEWETDLYVPVREVT